MWWSQSGPDVEFVRWKLSGAVAMEMEVEYSPRSGREVWGEGRGSRVGGIVQVNGIKKCSCSWTEKGRVLKIPSPKSRIANLKREGGGWELAGELKLGELVLVRIGVGIEGAVCTHHEPHSMNPRQVLYKRPSRYRSPRKPCWMATLRCSESTAQPRPLHASPLAVISSAIVGIFEDSSPTVHCTWSQLGRLAAGATAKVRALRACFGESSDAKLDLWDGWRLFPSGVSLIRTGAAGQIRESFAGGSRRLWMERGEPVARSDGAVGKVPKAGNAKAERRLETQTQRRKSRLAIGSRGTEVSTRPAGSRSESRPHVAKGRALDVEEIGEAANDSANDSWRENWRQG
ncbi:hypothetical protein AXG93_1877s1090 [Marchantia polymorpha subsp. ruderalis]|uniref:Uncharacterized protein n=1 Tax=Marchantia polymorpha subsp. ruderalis TaxID=1480154 RepID=A0A176VUL3_MARPO|nr:hypothetical protein AXG93_1877s1090 [Marchantia polymorpha subsp. ruderalis]